MPSHVRQFLAPLAVASLAAATVVAAAPITQARPAGATAVAASPDISVANTQAHLNQLQSIATANGGNRYTGRAGYTASITYVKGKLDAAGYTTTVQNFSTSAGTSSNLIAEWPAGDANNVVMLGGHLDSVSNGPGINDNGSGSAGVLEAALAYAASGQSAKSRLRIGFWGAEELGLLGSKYYMNSLPTAEKNKIRVYLNFDMIGSPNPGYFVYDDNAAGNAARDELTAWYTSKGIPWEYIDVQGRSDHAAFRSYGIATAGIFSGAETLKSSSQATKWGGTAGRAFDPCYHSSCDTISNINVTSLDRGVDLIGHMLWLYAAKDYGTTTPPTGGNLLVNPGFESGAVNWTGTSGPITNNSARPARTGTWKAWLGGNGSTSTETIQQSVAIPSTVTAANLSFWLRTDTAESGSTAYDTLKVQVVDGSTTTTLATYSNVGANATYAQKSLNFTAYKGKTVAVKFLLSEDSSLQTSFVVDDTAVSTS
ncbi:putative hydrolase (putative membrane protein) [Janibacter sp. HTCC2649]|uniref:M28 family peptidase n=1 Tax=Janibacter sp. HTCC2649 TaxID=313589 RepID=UPI000066EC94|nr:M28 family peptidase [Janibacter sp. HTCC2649]EAP99185.1 putative hydrolase (putative membrane protein) [Janibacter sp. HTCC2649]